MAELGTAECVVRRTTLDKLERHVAALLDERYDVQVIYVGGRDYTLVCTRSTA